MQHRSRNRRDSATPPSGVAPKPFTLEHFRKWALKLTLDNGNPWVLEDFQAAFAADVFTGVPENWLVIPEENAKTTLAAGFALYHCEFTISAWVPVAAASREQAEIAYRQAEGFVLRSPRLKKLFRCLEGYRRIICKATGSRIQVFAADDRTGDGVIPTLCLIDELHRHRDLKLYRTWRGKLGKRKGQIITISTAGEPGGEFEVTREKIRQAAVETNRTETFVRAASPNLILHEWAVPQKGDIEDMELVKRANPLKAVTVDSLRTKWESPTMTREHWSRYVCNLPTRSESAAIQEIEWAAAETDEKIPEGQPIWVGLDLGWKWDTTAIVPFWYRDENFRLFGPVRVLVPPRDSTSLDPDKIERALVEIHERNPIHTVVMDMSRGEDTANWIKTELGAEVVDRTQGNEFACQDYEKFMEALRNGQLKHSGDADLKAHALNAIARMTPSGKARFDRHSQTRQGGDQERRVIDALTAAAMVHATVALLPPAPFAGIAFR